MSRSSQGDLYKKGKGSTHPNNKRQITNADYATEEYQNIKVPAGSSQEALDLLYNSNVPFEARIFQSSSSDATLNLYGSVPGGEDETWLREERLRHEQLPWYQRPSLYMICVVILLFAFSQGVSLSSKLQLMINVICRDVAPGDLNSATCNKNVRVQQEISKLESAMTVSGNVLATLLSGKICELSDRYGRKPVLSIVAGTLLISKVLVLSLIHPLVNTYHPALIVLASSIESVGGGTITLMSLSNTYISDIVDQKDRILKMGIVSGCLFGSMGLGPFIGSLVIKKFNSNLIACFIDLVFVLLLILFCVLIFPESRSCHAKQKSKSLYSLQRERQIRMSSGNKKWWSPLYHYFKHLFEPLKMLLVPEHTSAIMKDHYIRKVQFFILLTIMGFFSLGAMFMGRIFVLYPTYMFKWNSEDIGYFLTLMMVSRAIVLFAISPYLLRYLKNNFATRNRHLDQVDLIILKSSLILELVGSIILTYAKSSRVYSSSQLVTCFGALLTPTIDSMVIKYSPVGKVGQMMGALSMVKSLLASVIPSLLLILYSTTVANNPRIVLYMMLALLAVANLLACLLRERNDDVDDDTEDEADGTVETIERVNYGSTST